MFGFQFYIVLGDKRYGLQIVPFHWSFGWVPYGNNRCVAVGPFIATFEQGVH